MSIRNALEPEDAPSILNHAFIYDSEMSQFSLLSPGALTETKSTLQIRKNFLSLSIEALNSN